MVFQYILRPHQALRHPWETFFLGMLYPSLAILLSLWVFDNYIGFTVVALTTLAAVPFVYHQMRHEERGDLLLKTEQLRLRAHSKVLFVYLFLFLGSVVAFALWHMYLPADLRESVFSIQEATIQNVNSNAVGQAISASSFFSLIFTHNFKLLIFCFVFSLFFGAGALYLLTFNASIIGTAVGLYMQERATGMMAGVFSLGLLRYLTHGIFEISGFFLAGLAGGILSIALLRQDLLGKKSSVLFQDAFALMLLAVLFVFLGALVEIHLTPLFY